MKPQTKTPPLEIERPMPSNVEAERSVLGAILVAGFDSQTSQVMAIDVAEEVLKPEDFFLEQHSKIFKAMLDLTEKQVPIDPIILTETMGAAGELARAGGAPYLSSLADGMPRVSNVRHYATIIKNKSLLRELIHLTHSIQQRAFGVTEEETEIIFASAESAILGVTQKAETSRITTLTKRNAGISLLKSLTPDSPGIRIFTGIAKLDAHTGGFRAGELVTITAGTGVGKTFLAEQISRAACTQEFHGLYCSGEMTAEHLASRELATEAGVPHWKMRRPENITSEERQRLLEQVGRECTKCETLDGELSVRRIRLASRKMKQVKGLSWVVLDYDELIDAPGKDEFAQQRTVVREAKALAMTLGVPVFMISQLRKPLNPAEAKKPTLERLYGSGAKSKHSSFVIFVDREYVRELKGDETKARICILKSRDGRIGEIPAVFNITTLRFEDFVDEFPEEPSKKKQKQVQERHYTERLDL